MHGSCCHFVCGTDGEDGPTNAAGAFADQHLIERLQQHKPDAADHLHRNDAYTFFKLLDGLILWPHPHECVRFTRRFDRYGAVKKRAG